MNRKIVNAIRATALVGALAVGSFVLPSAANASVTGCQYDMWSDTQAGVTCNTSAGDEYRAKVTCTKYNGTGSIMEFGPWKTSGWSNGNCITGTYASNVTVGI